VTKTAPAATRYDVEAIRTEFPALHQEVHGHPLAYLDNAATSQKPRAVLDAMERFYTKDCANVHRGVHQLSLRATESYEGARAILKRFLGARSTKEIVFVRGTTEAINLVAQSWGRPRLGPGDEIVVTHMEHHSNIVPWQILCQQTGATLRVVPIDETGSLEEGALEATIGPKTRLVSVVHVSNALGTVNPIERIVELARSVGALVCVDGAQAAPHVKIDVRALDVDFYAVSGHKMYGPTGSGVLYGKEEHLASMEPYQGGGDMILSVSFDGTTYNELPYKFEAGTPDIAAMIGMAAAASYLENLGFDAIAAHEHDLLVHATEAVQGIPGLSLVGTAENKAGVLSFVVDGIHPHDLGTVLDQEGIAVRTGHHCAQPVMERFRIPATTRASFGIYNTLEEADRLARAIVAAKEMFDV